MRSRGFQECGLTVINTTIVESSFQISLFELLRRVTVINLARVELPHIVDSIVR